MLFPKAIALSCAARIAETAFVGKICRRERRRRDAMTPGRFEQFKSISTIAMHSNGGHRT
jgi:hypothetical protein